MGASPWPRWTQVSLCPQCAPTPQRVPGVLTPPEGPRHPYSLPQRVPGVPHLQHHKGPRHPGTPQKVPGTWGLPGATHIPLSQRPLASRCPPTRCHPPSYPPQAYVVSAAAIALPLLHAVGDEANGRCHPHQALEPPSQLPPKLDALRGPPGGAQLVGAIPQQPLSRHRPHQALRGSVWL